MAKALPHINDPYHDSPNYMEYSAIKFSKSRDRLISLIESSPFGELGAKPISAESGYFLYVDIECFRGKVPPCYFSNDFATDNQLTLRLFPDGKVPFDYAACRWFGAEKGFIPMPGSMFYLPGSPNTRDHYVRFSFCREPESFDELEKPLMNFKI